jgi:hypothetical protein
VSLDQKQYPSSLSLSLSPSLASYVVHLQHPAHVHRVPRIEHQQLFAVAAAAVAVAAAARHRQPGQPGRGEGDKARGALCDELVAAL